MIISYIIEFGHIALITAFGLSLVQIFFPIFGNVRYDYFYKSTPLVAVLSFLCTLIAFLILLLGFIKSDFSLNLVYQFSHTSKPFIYKVSGTWANHEGSLLLWILILQFFGALISYSKIPIEFKAKVLSVHGLISSSFLGLSLFSSNPFLRSIKSPLEGLGLNPVLQDLALAFHPPILYIGYVGLSVSFAFAIVSLIEGKIDRFWAKMLRPWVLISWIALTLGISLGSFWAYYELGWGGWWFWDPVENVALMPWLLTTALVHSVIVFENRNKLKAWTILLSILAFCFSIFGTFIVRSGIITSVHSFASDPKRGLIILSILLVASVLPLTLFGFRSKLFKNEQNYNILSRETLLIFNNFFLVISALIVLTGTIYPLILEFINNMQITVGPPYFVTSLTPLILIAMALMGLGPLLSWGRDDLSKILFKILPSLILILLITFTIFFFKKINLIALSGFVLSIWIIITVLTSLFHQFGLNTLFNNKGEKKIRSLTFNQAAVAIAHIGVAIFAIGAVSESHFSKEVTIRANAGETISIGSYKILFTEMKKQFGSNFISEVGVLKVMNKKDKLIKTLYPEKRYFPVENQITSEVSIHRQFFGDIYAVLGDGNEITGYTFRIYLKPFVSWIWIGSLLMCLGGICSLYTKINISNLRSSKIKLEI